MTGERKRPAYTYHHPAPLYTNEEIVDDSQDVEIDVVNVQSGDIRIEEYEEEVEDGGFYLEMLENAPVLKRAKRDAHYTRRMEKMDKISENIVATKVNLIDLGTNVMVGTSNKTITETNLDKAVKDGIHAATFLGDISIESLVLDMMTPSASDGRYGMLGTSVMLNALKTNMRDLKSNIVEQTWSANTEPRFDMIDVNIANIPFGEKYYAVQSQGVFASVDLYPILNMQKFRNTAKILNKAKQFLKAYFVVSCYPRCMIWRYTLRRCGNSSRKAILNLPDAIVQTILNLLIDATGIGNADKSFDELDRHTPFFHSLGEDESLREQRYYEICKLKDPLINFFRNAITDTLNEIREMPFCWSAGKLISPLRGRVKGGTCVMWKEYEELLRQEQEMPSEANMIARRKFEQLACDRLIRHGHTIR
ncbi:unnamed protein product [Caenorhabditis brenneri]